jgi:hypothetical protein
MSLKNEILEWLVTVRVIDLLSASLFHVLCLLFFPLLGINTFISSSYLYVGRTVYHSKQSIAATYIAHQIASNFVTSLISTEEWNSSSLIYELGDVFFITFRKQQLRHDRPLCVCYGEMVMISTLLTHDYDLYGIADQWVLQTMLINIQSFL